jgi:hypothetical protein
MPLARDNNGVWRLRSQSKYLFVDICLGPRSWPAATEHLFSWEGSLSVVYHKGRG